MQDNLLEAIKRFYKYKDKKTLSTSQCLVDVKRYFEINNKELMEDLTNYVRINGSLRFMQELEKNGIVEKAPGYCNCNGGTWRKK